MDNELQRKKLIDYIPEYTRQFSEIKEMMKVEEIQVEMIDAKIQEILDNCFIDSCNEYGIKKYEQFLNIIPNKEDTLESRKSRVKIRWNEYVPYTVRTLVRKLNAMCGVNNYTIINDLKHYNLVVITRFTLYGELKEVEKLMERILPMNIHYTIKNQLQRSASGTVLIQNISTKLKHETIST